MANELDAPLGLTLTAAFTEDATTLLFACLPRTLSDPNKHIFVFILPPDTQFDRFQTLERFQVQPENVGVACKLKTNQVANLKKESDSKIQS